MTHEEMIENKCPISDIKYKELHNLCKGVANFIEQNFSPHTNVVINAENKDVTFDINVFTVFCEKLFIVSFRPSPKLLKSILKWL